MRRVLVVFDEPVVRDALAQFLTGLGLAVHTATSVAAARAQQERLRADAVVLGATIELDVEALLARVRGELPHLGVVILHDGPVPAPRAGVIALRKPVQLPRLHAALLEVMRRGLA